MFTIQIQQPQPNRQPMMNGKEPPEVRLNSSIDGN